MKWNYDNKNKQWWITESFPYANNDYTIKKITKDFTREDKPYKLEDHYGHVGYFKKLSTAKLIAKHLREG